MKPDRCKACGRVKKRSTEANRRYWLILHLIADRLEPEGQKFSAETWHTYFKQRYLGVDEIRLPNKKVVLQPKSSAELDKDAFADYMMAVETWAQEHDVYLDEEVAA